MVMETVISVLDSVNRIFVFNPEIIHVAKEFASGHYEWSWVVLMLGALFLWNAKCWSFFRNEREKTPQTVIRAVAEGALHWCLSNAALFGAIELHKAVYGHFTEYVAVADTDFEKISGIRQAMVGALTKIHLMNKKMTMVPQIRSPQVPFGIMVAFSLVVISLAFLVRKQGAPESDESGGESAEDVQRGYDWNEGTF